MFFITSKNSGGSYCIEEVVDNWRAIVNSWEPIDVVNGEILIFNELGQKYYVGPNRKFEHQKLFGKLDFLSSIDVGKWNFEKGEPFLIKAEDVDSEELKEILLEYAKTNNIDLKAHQTTTAEDLLLAVAHWSAVSKMPSNIVKAHAHCSNHRQEVLASNICGCFYCLEAFRPTEIKEWVDDGNCAICPKCGIDSVIGGKSGYPINKKFLTDMHDHWF